MDGQNLAKVRREVFLDVAQFLSSTPEIWRERSGELLASEAETRIQFARRYCASSVLAWLGAELGVEALVSGQFADYDRAAFFNLIQGKWLAEVENERN